MQTFNEWMAHIHRELGYPETKIKTYEQNCTSQTIIQNNQRWTNTNRGDANVGENEDYSRINFNQ
jgi:hypothetical protein